MHYKIAICDDEAADRALLDTLVRRWAAAAGHTVQLEAFESAEQFLFHYAEENDYDVLLLDVEMGQMDGVALAREIRKQNEAVQIVFITGFSDYIAEGYEVAALHYLMKPVREEKLFSVLDRAAQKVAKNERVLHLLTGGEMVQVPVHKIRYAEVMGNYVTLHAGEEVTVKMTLTSPGCPLGAEITSAAYLSIARLPGVKDCQVDLVWSPMWDPEKHPSEEAKAALGLW